GDILAGLDRGGAGEIQIGGSRHSSPLSADWPKFMAMARQPIASGTVHSIPADFRKAIQSDAVVMAVWASITPLARNEWGTSAKKDETKNRRIEVGLDKMRNAPAVLLAGMSSSLTIVVKARC